MTDDLSDLVLDNKKQLITVKNNSKHGKGGRPKKVAAEKLSKKVTVNFSETEYQNLTDKAGMIPLTVFIKKALMDNGYI